MQRKFHIMREKYPRRNLKEGAIVTRFAPSPTGFVHIGGLYQSLIARKLASQTDGVFFLKNRRYRPKKEKLKMVLVE